MIPYTLTLRNKVGGVLLQIDCELEAWAELGPYDTDPTINVSVWFPYEYMDAEGRYHTTWFHSSDCDEDTQAIAELIRKKAAKDAEVSAVALEDAGLSYEGRGPNDPDGHWNYKE